MTLKSLTTQGLGTSLKRSDVRYNINRQDAKDMILVKENDHLPIVELKPFVQKVWRREKSLADKRKSTRSVSERVDSPRSRPENKKDLEISLEENYNYDVSSSQSSGTYNLLPPPTLSNRLVAFYVNAFDDFKSQEEHFHKFVSESSLRPKLKLHPVVDPKNRKPPEHTANIIPAFITRDDRTKTTLQEISDGESTSRLYSCSPKAIGPEEDRKLREIRISGENIAGNEKPSSESSPTPTKGITNGSWHGHSVRHGSPASMLYYNKSKHKLSQQRAKTPLYDYLDRSGALPSLSVHAKCLRNRESKHYDDTASADYRDYSESFSSSTHNSIGGIENALIMLSKYGCPTKVERHISLELERNLSRLRKCKDYSPLEVSRSELAKHYTPSTFNMTQGEIHIRAALQSSTWHRQRNAFLNSHDNHKKNYFKLLGKAKWFTNGLRKDIFPDSDQTDSFGTHIQHLYKCNTQYKTPYKTIGKDVTHSAKTPNDEPMAPYDTPRSQVDNEANVVKLQDIRINKHQETVLEENRNETQSIVYEQSQTNFVKTVINKHKKKLADSTVVRPKSEELQRRSNNIINIKDLRQKSKESEILVSEILADNRKSSEINTLERTGLQSQTSISKIENVSEPIQYENQPIVVSAATGATLKETLQSIDFVGKTFITSGNVQELSVI